MKERTISYAYDNVIGSTIDINCSISSHKDGFALRDDYNSNTERFSCKEQQKLVVSHSTRDNVYFRHLPNSGYCILKDNDLSDDVLKGYKDNAFARETPRHKELKNRIGQLLHFQEGVEIASIDIDSKFIIRGDQKRRPDVFCLFEGKNIAFEIQLSYLPQHYIKHRYEFYRKHGIYLIWIIDTSGPLELKTFERDLKYIWPHQNLFRLDESNHSSLKMVCHFKQPFIFENVEVRHKWSERSISLSELTFEESDFSSFYVDYAFACLKINQMLAAIQQQQRKEAAKEIKLVRDEENYRVITNMLADVKKFLKLDYNFYRLIQEFNNLDFTEVEVLNCKVNLGNTINGIPLFLHYIKEYIPRDDRFKDTIADLLLGCRNFKFDINLRDETGKGIIEYVYLNNHLQKYRYRLLPFIFNRGYILHEGDRNFLTATLQNGENEYFKLRCFFCCENETEITAVKNNISYFLFIESAKQKRIIDSNLKHWVQYMVPIMSRYKEYWSFTKVVISKTDLGKELETRDKKGTIKKKIVEFNLDHTPQNEDIVNPLMKLYPEIFCGLKQNRI